MVVQRYVNRPSERIDPVENTVRHPEHPARGTGPRHTFAPHEDTILGRFHDRELHERVGPQEQLPARRPAARGEKLR